MLKRNQYLTQRKGKLLPVFLFISCLVMTGFSFTSELTLPKTEEEKREIMEKGLKGSPAHFKWTQTIEGKPYSRPTNDKEALKKVKKVGIVGFNVNLYAKKKTAAMLPGSSLLNVPLSIIQAKKEKEGINPEELKTLTEAMYDDFTEALKKRGIEIIPVEQVLSNELYKSFKQSGKEGEVSGIWSLTLGWKAAATPRGLKYLSALDILNPSLITMGDEMKKNAQLMQELARSLGVDAVVTVDNRIYLEASRFGGAYDLLFANDEKGPDGISVDVFWAEEPRPIWSISLAQPLKVPVEAGQENRLAAMAGWTKYEFGKVMGDISYAYRIMVDIITDKWKMDQ